MDSARPGRTLTTFGTSQEPGHVPTKKRIASTLLKFFVEARIMVKALQMSSIAGIWGLLRIAIDGGHGRTHPDRRADACEQEAREFNQRRKDRPLRRATHLEGICPIT